MDVEALEAALPPASPLTQARVSAEMTGSELARRLVVSRNLVSRWERGLNVPHRKYHPAIAAALGIDVADVAALFADEPAAKGESVLAPGLARARRAARLSQSALAVGVGVHVATVGAWERCRKAIPTWRLPTLATALGTPVNLLLMGSTPRKRTFPPLAELRRRRGLSRSYTAEQLGIGVKRLRGLETRCEIPVHLRYALAALYQVSPLALDQLKGLGVPRPSRRNCVLPLPPTVKRAPELWEMLCTGLSSDDVQWVVATIWRYLPAYPINCDRPNSQMLQTTSLRAVPASAAHIP